MTNMEFVEQYLNFVIEAYKFPVKIGVSAQLWNALEAELALEKGTNSTDVPMPGADPPHNILTIAVVPGQVAPIYLLEYV